MSTYAIDGNNEIINMIRYADRRRGPTKKITGTARETMNKNIHRWRAVRLGLRPNENPLVIWARAPTLFMVVTIMYGVI
jgi:hypothetical protein